MEYNSKKEETTAQETSKKAARLLARKEIGQDGRFTAYDDATVLDTRTNLMWAAKDNDNGSNINWQGAKSYCENYRGGGYTDWRMPTQDELAGLYDANKAKKILKIFSPAITDLINISTMLWASQTRGSKAAAFNFFLGREVWQPPYKDILNGTGALPVRSGK